MPAVVAAVLSVVIVASLVVLVTRLVRDTDPGENLAARAGQVFVGSDEDPEQSTREIVMKQASQFILRVNTYGPGDLDATGAMPDYTARVSELMSAKLKTSFEKSVTLAEQPVNQSGVGREAMLFSSGVQSLDADTATVLVAGSITTSYPDPEAKDSVTQRVDLAPRPFRISIDLVLTDGEWLVDNFEAVVSPGEEEAGDPLQPVQPTQQPTQGTTPPSPTRSPGAGQPSTGAPGAQSSGGASR